jgi:hypothetical protein
MIKRGRVVRDSNAGSGLLTNKRYAVYVVLENMWASDVP